MLESQGRLPKKGSTTEMALPIIINHEDIYMSESTSSQAQNYLETHGEKLTHNGYTVLPLSAGHKGPRLTDWPQYTPERSREDIPQWIAQHTGIGILCNNVVAIDVDVLDEDVADRLCEFLRTRLEDKPFLCRIGKAPKFLVLFQVDPADDIKKRTTPVYTCPESGEKHQLELLAKGQQFVAWHIHPDTGQPYVWTDRDPLTAHRDYLPQFTQELWNDLVNLFDEIAPEDWVKPDEPDADTPKENTGRRKLSVDEVSELLEFIPRRDDYDDWRKVGMCLHHWDDQEGLILWDQYSSECGGYKGFEDLEAKWATFTHKDKGLTIATLIKAARKKGWVNTTRTEPLLDLIAKADVDTLKTEIMPEIRLLDCDVMDREDLARAIQARFKELRGGKVAAIGAFRKMVARTRTGLVAGLMLDRFGEPKPVLYNFKLLLDKDSAIVGLGFNELKNRIVKRKDLPWAKVKDKRNGDDWTDEDALNLCLHVGEVHRMTMTDIEAFRVAGALADNNRFHPIQDYLCNLKWDGKPRLDTMLNRHLGVAVNEYTTAVSRKILCAAVARVFEPGCKSDHCAILIGHQGGGKSSFVHLLCADPGWFGDDVQKVTSKEVIESTAGRWIIELSELQAFSKTEVESLKAFISRQVDTARGAYRKFSKDNPRRFIFIGTTNDQHFLKDETGNRRFWPIQCTIPQVNFEAVVAERDQLWAEAFIKYRAGEPLRLEDPATEALALEEQTGRLVGDDLAGKIEQWLEDNPEITLVCGRRIWEECLNYKENPYDKGKATPIYAAMDRVEGWSKYKGRRRLPGFGRQYGWKKD